MNILSTDVENYWGELSEDSQLIPIKYGFALIGSGTTPPTGQEEYYGDSVPWVTTSELRENIVASTEKCLSEQALQELSALKIYSPGTVLIAMYGATIGRVAMLGIYACVNQAVCAMAQPTSLEPKFVMYALQASRNYLLSLASGGGQPNLNAEKIKEHLLPCPPLFRQRAIADYLDRATAKIDALIAAKQRLLDLLAEKRRALITHVVTRGLDAAVPLRDSGVEWLGRIPRHWEMVRIKHIGQVGNGSTPLRDNKAYWHGGTFPWLTSTVVNSDIIEEPTELVTDVALRECHLPIVRSDSILVAITGEGKTRGKAALLPYSATINQHMAFISPQPDVVNAKFLQLFLSGSYEILRMISEGTGSTKGALTCEQLSEFPVPLPPLNEQQKIASYTNLIKARLDALAQGIEKTIGLLQERRVALIAAAVTGKLWIQE